MYIDRTLQKEFDLIITGYTMVAVVGPRQAGKTTFLRHQLEKGDGEYVLMDDVRSRELFDDDIHGFITQHVEGRDVTVLDEVHMCKEPGQSLKFLVDSGHTIWFTASSETILSREVLSYLVGRVSIMRLFPFSLEEMLVAKDIRAYTPRTLREMITEHVVYGGYPEVVLTEDPRLKVRRLKDLFETVLLKDAVVGFSLTDSAPLRKMATVLAGMVGSLVSYDHLGKTAGLSFKTVKSYIDVLELSGVIRLVRPFHSNAGKEVSKRPKVYFIDTGLRNAVLDSWDRSIDGSLFENLVFSELMKAGISCHYWRTKAGAEVDFVVSPAGRPIPVEVKLSGAGIERSFRSFIDSYEPERGFIVTLDGEPGSTSIKGCEVNHVDVPTLIKDLRKLRDDHLDGL